MTTSDVTTDVEYNEPDRQQDSAALRAACDPDIDPDAWEAEVE